MNKKLLRCIKSGLTIPHEYVQALIEQNEILKLRVKATANQLNQISERENLPFEVVGICSMEAKQSKEVLGVCMEIEQKAEMLKM